MNISKATILVSNGLTKIHDVPNGTSIEGVIQLQNSGQKSEDFIAYLQDIHSSCSGQITYAEAGTNTNSLSKYLQLSTNQATLAPGSTYDLLYRIILPKDVQLQGSFWSLLMVEVVNPIQEQNPEKGFTVGSKIRYGIQIIANVGPSENPQFLFTDFNLSKDQDGNRILETSLENQGLFLALPSLELKIFDSSGELVDQVFASSKKLYPGYCNQFHIPLKYQKPGTYKAVLLAEYKEQLKGVNLDLEF